MQTTIKQSAQQNKYYIINQNYQDYQNNFHFGLDYRIFSKNAKVIEMIKNEDLKIIFEVSRL
ncbi:hypothetical protein HCBAA847_1513 [Helicobacter cinaedi CCUG 18818 = ATCC BAA-847]|uniref:Uncharacterized protein n=1 Tax=Helicobacter cinaedi CCUG 18818 = ATCC BAA-847 TaxID=537971 RepID=A0AAI8QHH5_9HELI|nr:MULTISPECIES: hypothetical protein [Helicobacter]EFR47675.1 hypothetical protein HCCG_02224 [Helicobacter cinaedi CCUG 18818 = ATCC BAA-847]BAM32743.1 hypothetical protein HCBAA847_1513 [Helicobacter cinaedi CCUG 18818 = ATCC BAA-847]STQ85093.1 Uncharacterised protein [Helicobacter fennelliae]